MMTRRLALVSILLTALAGSSLQAETVHWSGTLADGWHPDMEFLPVPGAPWDAVLVSFDYNWPPSAPNEVHVYHAGSGQDALIDLVIDDPHPDDRKFGDDLAVVQDLNGDGEPDFIVAAPIASSLYEHSRPRGFYVYHGGPGMDAVPDLDGRQLGGPYNDLGDNCVGGGDWNGDGYGDFLISADFFTPHPLALVYFGGPGLDEVPDLVIPDVYIAAGDGDSAARFDRDFNNDGYSDLAIHLADGQGSVGVFYGGPTPDAVVDAIIDTSPYSGRYELGAGDVDADGYDDLLTARYGEVHVHRGGASLAAAPDMVFSEDRDRFRLDGHGAMLVLHTDFTEIHAEVLTATVNSEPLVAFDGLSAPTSVPELGLAVDVIRGYLRKVPGVGYGSTDGILTLSYNGDDTAEVTIFTDLILDHDNDGIPDVYEVPAGTAEDCDGNGLADVSESRIWTQLDCDGDLTLDVCQLAGRDCDGDSILDSCQIAAEIWRDCNVNGMLDSCEPLTPQLDRDGNGLIDCEEISENSWLDCNGDWVLDSVQFAGTDTDCDGDGINDYCEIVLWESEDCNGDVIPDECQLDGAGFDTDGSGVLDVCEVGGSLVEDCDNNGRKDYWDILYHPADDCDRNGFLDACEGGTATPTCGPMPYIGVYFDEALTVTDLDPAALPEFGYLYLALRQLAPGEATAIDHYAFGIVAPPSLNIVGAIVEPQGAAQDVAGANEEVWVTIDGPLAADANGDVLLARITYFKTSTPEAGTGVRVLGMASSTISNDRPSWRDAVTGDHRVVDTRVATFAGAAADCNHNGQDDALDISGGISPDDNADGVPDECQLSGVRLPAAGPGLSVAPNPFNPRTTVSFHVPRDGHVRLVVHDVSGRRIRTLHEGVMTAGPQSTRWDGRDEHGSGAASGIYFVRLETGGAALTRKVVLLR